MYTYIIRACARITWAHVRVRVVIGCACKRARHARRAFRCYSWRVKGRQTSSSGGRSEGRKVGRRQGVTPGAPHEKQESRGNTSKTPSYDFISIRSIFFTLRYLRYILHLGVFFREIFGKFFGIIGKGPGRFYFLYHSRENTGSNGFLLSDVVTQNRNFSPFWEIFKIFQKNFTKKIKKNFNQTNTIKHGIWQSANFKNKILRENFLDFFSCFSEILPYNSYRRGGKRNTPAKFTFWRKDLKCSV